MTDHHASGDKQWQAPTQRGLPVVEPPPVKADPPPRPRASGWSPTLWRRRQA